MRQQTYPGYDNDQWGGFTEIGRIIRDGKVFGFIPDDEQCKDWPRHRLEKLWEDVTNKWDEFSAMPGNLPPELREKHASIHAVALEKAKSLGWTPEEWLTASDFDGWIKEEDLDSVIPPEWLEQAERHR
jgi:hypothetical protein